MSQFQVDADTGALVRVDGSFVRIDGVEEIAQHVRVRLRLIQGEVPYNTLLGLRYLGVLLGKGTPPEVRDSEIADAVVGTPGVVTVQNVSSVLDDSTRVLTVTFSATIDVADARRRIPLHDVFSITLAA